MKNFILSLFLLSASLLLAGEVYAQRASESPEEFVKGETGNAVTLVVTGLPKNVAKVVGDKFQQGTGKKPKPLKGNQSFLGVQYPQISSATLDIYFRVEPAGKGTESSSRVIVFLSAGQSNFLSSRSYPEEISRMFAWMEQLPEEVRKYELELAIEEQKKLIDKDTREHERMVKDSVELQKTLAETYKAIEENKTSRINQLKKIDDDKLKLKDLEQARQDMDGAILPKEQDQPGGEKKED